MNEQLNIVNDLEIICAQFTTLPRILTVSRPLPHNLLPV